MASVKQLVLDSVATALETISTANNYNTNIQKVIKGKLVPNHRVPPNWRQSYACVIFAGQQNESGQSDHTNLASADISVYASMSNVTSGSYMMFLDDIEASISADTLLETSSDTYNVQDIMVTSIDIMDSAELDEVLSPEDEQYKDRESLITISVVYLYTPKFLSGY